MSRTVVTGKTFATNPTIKGNATFTGVEGISIPTGSTAERPTTPSEGVIRYNATTGKFEGYSKDPNNSAQSIWGSLGGGALLDLSDIDETGLQDGNLLKWDSVLTKFVPTEGTLLDTIKVSGQTDITIPSSGDLEMESGAGIQLTTDPSTGKITISSTTQANLSVDTFTADGNTKEFDLSRVPTQPVDVLVHVDSLYQAPSTYTIVGTSPAKLVFPENIPVNLEISVTFLNMDTVQTIVQDGSITPAKLSASTYYIDTFYGDASTTTYTLSQLASTPNQLLVTIDGVIQTPGADNAYSVTGTTLTFTSPPAYNALVKVRFMGATFSTASSISPNAVGIPEMDIGGSGISGQVLGLGSSGGFVWISPSSADFIYNAQTFTNASSVEFNVASGFTMTETSPGVLKVGFGDYLTTVSVSGQPTISIDSTRELEFVAGSGVSIVTDNTVEDKKLTWSVAVGALAENVLPSVTSTYDIGSSSKIWDTVYTNTLDLGSINLTDDAGTLQVPSSIRFGGGNPITLTATSQGLELEKITIGTPAQITAGEDVTLTVTSGKLNLPAANVGIQELNISNSGTAGQFLSTTGSLLQWVTPLTEVSVGTGLQLSGGGSTIISTGTIILDPQVSQDAQQGTVAYGWGNHASAGYLADITTENLTNLADVATGTLGIGNNDWSLVWDNSSAKFKMKDMRSGWNIGSVAGSTYYGEGRVGIGISAPTALLHINQQESNPSDPIIIQDGAYRPLYIPTGGILTTQTGIHLETDYANITSPTAPTTGGIFYFKNGNPHFVSSTIPEQALTASALPVYSDSGSLEILLNSEALTIAGGTGIDTSGSGNTLTVTIDSTVVTLDDTQTLTLKTLTSPTINSPILDTVTINTSITGSAIDTDGTFAANSDTLVPSQKAVKTYVDSSWDSPTFHIDAVNNRVGIGTATPGVLLDVDGGDVNITKTTDLNVVMENTGDNTAERTVQMQFRHSAAGASGVGAYIKAIRPVSLADGMDLVFGTQHNLGNVADKFKIDRDGHFHMYAGNVTTTGDLGCNDITCGDITCDDISTADLIMSNDRADRPGNEIDGTKGSWVMQEGDESMYLINRSNGKRYKIMLEEV